MIARKLIASKILGRYLGSKPKVLKESINTNTYKDFTELENQMIQELQPFTMTSRERLKALINSVEYIISQRIEGDFVECGVWKGGSSMAIAKTLLINNISNRDIWLFDTFDGMSEPSDVDKDVNGLKAKTRLQDESKETSFVWAYSPIEEVKSNLDSTGYPREHLKFIVGKVENTLMIDNIPDKIALLRLDTDWYDSTKVEMEVLFPRVVKNGIVIIDDYGHWQGSKLAVDEYIKKNNLTIFLSRIDYTGRLIVKNI